MSDEDTLRRAATKVREISGGATPGPWQYLGPDAALTDADLDDGADYDGHDVQVLAGTALASGGGHGPCHEFVHEHSDLGCEDYESDAARIGSARWMALVNPAVAETLAAWLEAEAGLIPAVAGVGENAPKLLDSIAEEQGVKPPSWEFSIGLSTTPSAVAFARALLGEQVPA